jgi:hypothetical protein
MFKHVEMLRQEAQAKAMQVDEVFSITIIIFR